MHKIAAFMVVLASVIWATGGPAVKVLLNYGLTENEICPIPSVKMPVTKTHPVIIITNAILFFSVNFSLKKITEISITIAGAVYTNTTATLMGIRCKAYP